MNAEEIVKLQRAYYRAGNTRPYVFRKKMLETLEETVRKYENQIKEALYEDLHKSSQEAYMTEIGLALSEISYVKKHLRSWMKEKGCRLLLCIFRHMGALFMSRMELFLL